MTRRIALKLAGKYVGANPSEPTDAAYADREAVGGWETLELTKRDDGKYEVRFVDAHKAMSVTPAREIQTRAWDAIGGWEVYRAAEIPPDWPAKLISDNGLAFEIEYL